MCANPLEIAYLEIFESVTPFYFAHISRFWTWFSPFRKRRVCPPVLPCVQMQILNVQLCNINLAHGDTVFCCKFQFIQSKKNSNIPYLTIGKFWRILSSIVRKIDHKGCHFAVVTHNVKHFWCSFSTVNSFYKRFSTFISLL